MLSCIIYTYNQTYSIHGRGREGREGRGGAELAELRALLLRRAGGLDVGPHGGRHFVVYYCIV